MAVERDKMEGRIEIPTQQTDMWIILWNDRRWEFGTKEEQTSFKDYWKLRGECRCMEIRPTVISAEPFGLKGNLFMMIPE